MNFHFILVEPSSAGNIGSATRAIKTMGFKSLRLINPCDHLSKEARKLAYGSHDVLESAIVYHDLSEATHDLDFIIGTTAKNRTVWHDYFTPEQCVDLLESKGKSVQEIGVVFGREESGLSTEQLELCDLRSSIPLAAPYPSVNLAQSVMIYAHAFSTFAMKNESKPTSGNASEADQKVLKRKVTEMMQRIEISRNPNLSRRIMERMMLVDKDDMHLILSFHKFLSRYLDQFDQAEK